MSRVAKSPIPLVKGVDVNLSGEKLTIKGKNGSLELVVHADVEVSESDGKLTVSPRQENKASWAMAGTYRALVNNMVTGVSEGFQKKLQLVGVGYRAQVKGKVLNLSLGFSHPIDFAVPKDVKIETPSQTEVVVFGADKQRVGQVAAEIRSYRPPEPYKGKGVRYADEHVIRKDAKKK